MAAPTYLVIAGPNGAGKSTFAQEHSVGTRIDPDAIARELQPDNPRQAGIAAGKEASRRIQDHIVRGISVTQETTLSARRVADRVTEGGHDIPANAIARRFKTIMDNLPHAAAITDETAIRDNGDKDFNVILRQRDGVIVERASVIPKHLQAAVDRLEERSRQLSRPLPARRGDERP